MDRAILRAPPQAEEQVILDIPHVSRQKETVAERPGSYLPIFNRLKPRTWLIGIA